ncbi:hypothetical protein [Ralstonia pseudosolanacearum]|nr:hypothetical protein [Ralstonia pseudosolanacearum]
MGRLNTAIAPRERHDLPAAGLNIDFTAWNFRTCLWDAVVAAALAS